MTIHTINGQRLYAREDGTPNGQVALLLHGWSSSWYAMSPLLDLLGRRFACIAVDLPGYGNSPPLPTRTTIDAYADLLADLIRRRSPDGPVVLVGHSMGGMIALTIALRHPVLVERLVLLCPTISGKLSFFINTVVSPLTILERFPLANTAIANLEPHMLTLTDRIMRPASFAERSKITEEAYHRLRADARRPGQGRVRAECFSAMRDSDLRGRLSKVEAPSLVLWGAEDNTVPLRDAGVIVDEYPHADLRIIPKAGHWPQFETPDITNRYIAAYLGLPLITTRLNDHDENAAMVSRAAQFLANSDVGNGLSLPQRTRLAAQCTIRTHEPSAVIARAHDSGTDLYVVQEGTVEVWSDPQALGNQLPDVRQLATLLPGQITGELALLDGAPRSASLCAGADGATVMILTRDRLRALIEDDPDLGNRVLWNIAAALALRLRLTNWQMHMRSSEQVPS